MKKIIAFLLVFVMFFGDGQYLTPIIHPQAKAVSHGTYKLKENPYIQHKKGTKIPSVARTSYWGTRRFYMQTYSADSSKNKDIHRVFCGYGPGKSHHGDKYKCYTMSATEFVNAKHTPGARHGKISGTAGNGTYGKNPKHIAKALYWYFMIEKMGDKKDINKELAAQTYIWAASYDAKMNKALDELVDLNGHLISKKKIKKYWKEIKAVKKAEITGEVHIYDFYKVPHNKCKEKQSGLHQPYYRITPVVPDKDHLHRSADVNIHKTTTVEITKKDDAGQPLKNIEFTVTVNKSGYTLTGQTTVSQSGNTIRVKTNNEGKAYVYAKKEYHKVYTSPEVWFCNNWNSLDDKTKKALSKEGVFSTKKAAIDKASELAKAGSIKAGQKLAKNENATFTIKEVKASGYQIIQKNETKKVSESGTMKEVKDSAGKATKLEGKLTASYTNPSKYGKIIVQKKARDNNYTSTYNLQGAQYQIVATTSGRLKDASSKIKNEPYEFNAGDVLDVITIGSNNKAETKAIYPIGSYKVKEIKAPVGWELDTTEHTATLSDSGNDADKYKSTVDSATVTSTEDYSKVSITFVKTMGSDPENSQYEPGTTFKIVGKVKLKSGSFFSGTAVSDANGRVTFNKVPYGVYTISQVGDAYTTPDHIKVDPLPNIELVVNGSKKSNNNPTGEYNENNTPALSRKATFDQIPGTSITIRKVKKSPTGELTDNNEIIYVSSPEENATFRIYKGSLSEVRSGSESEYTYDESKKIADITTDDVGVAKSDDLEEGIYSIRQISGTEGYKYTEDWDVEVSQNNIGNLTFTKENPENSEMIQFYKVTQDLNSKGQKNGDPVPEEGAEFYLMDLSKLDKNLLDGFSDKTIEQRESFVHDHSDALIPLEKGSYPIVSDDTGKCYSKFELNYNVPEEGFVLLQTKGTEGYLLSSPIYSTEFEKYSNDTTNFWKLEEPLENQTEVFYGILKIHKGKVVDEKGTIEAEEGAKFHLEDGNSNNFYYPPFEADTNKQISSFITNENGDAYIPFISRGNYTLVQDEGSEAHELMEDLPLSISPKYITMKKEEIERFIESGFDESVLSEESKQSMLDVSEKTSDIVNTPLPFWFTVEKRSTETQKKLDDAIFSLYKVGEDGQRTLVGTKSTGILYKYDDLGLTDEEKEAKANEMLGRADFKIKEYGKYVLVEDVAPFGYLKSKEPNGIPSTDPNAAPREIPFTVKAENVKKTNSGLLYFEIPLPVAKKEGGVSKTDEGDALIVNDPPVKGVLGITKFGDKLIGLDSTINGFTYENQPLAGAKFKLVAAEDIKNDNEQVVWPKGTEISNGETDENGKLYFTYTDSKGNITNQFYPGSYEAIETEAPPNYKLLTDPIPLAITVDASAEAANNLTYDDPEDDESQDSRLYTYDYFLEVGTKFCAEDNGNIVDAKKIIFTHIEPPGTSWDVSAAKNNTVKMWKEGRTYYVSTATKNQDVYFNYDCSHMFQYFTSLEEVVFNNIETSYMEDSSYMFDGCDSLTELDMSNFKTPRLNTSDYMFSNCPNLKTIYFGNEEQKFPMEDITNIVGITVTPKYPIYRYCRPDDPEIENWQDHELTVDDFDFNLLTPTGPVAQDDFYDSAPDINVTADDIESITPNFPYFPDDLSKKSGELEVTIKLKADSDAGRTQLEYHDGDESSLELKTTITVQYQSPAVFSQIANEYPKHVAEATDDLITPSFLFRKVAIEDVNVDPNSEESFNIRTYDDAVFQIKAATDLVDNEGKDIASAGTEIVPRETTSDRSVSDGDTVLNNLINGYYYAKDPNAKDLFTVTEIQPPSGMNLNQTPEENTITIPNIKFGLESLSNSDITKLKDAGTDTIKVFYEFANNHHSVSIQFANEKSEEHKIKKIWDNAIEAGNIVPDSIQIKVKRKGTNNLVKTITLNKNDGWEQIWDDSLGDISQANTLYDFEEVEQDGYFYKQNPTQLVRTDNDYYELTFHNEITHIYKQFKKIWNDGDNVDQVRPHSLTVNLLRNGDVYKTYTLSSPNWETPKEKVEVNDPEGNPYNYEWEEIIPDGEEITTESDDVEGYRLLTYETKPDPNDPTISKTIYNNYHKTETTSEVQKVWDDENDNDNMRPSSIRVFLYKTVNNTKSKVNSFDIQFTNSIGSTGTMEGVNSIILNDENQWKAKAIYLPAYDSEGNPITYTWEEQEVNTGDLEEYSTEYNTVTN